MGRWKGGTPGQEELARLGTVPQLCGFRQIAYHSELRQALGGINGMVFLTVELLINTNIRLHERWVLMPCQGCLNCSDTPDVQ